MPSHVGSLAVVSSEAGSHGEQVTELVLFALPSLVYLLILGRVKRLGVREATARLGARWGTGSGYLLTLALVVPLALLGYVAIVATPAGALAASGANVTGASVATVTSAAAVLNVIARASGEEVFFRGLLGGVLMRRLGFGWGNLVQALLFLLPHGALLLVDAGFWPLLPVQFVAGWLLGLLRYKAGSFLPGAVLHAGTNLIAGIFAV